MPNQSSRTETITIRLKIETLNKIRRRVLSSKRYITVSQYIQNRLEYDLNRRHG